MSKEFKDANEFKEFFEEFRKKDCYKDPLAFGIARIDRGQKNTDKNSIDEYLLAMIEAVAWGIVRIEIISMIPIVFIFMIMAEETSIIIK